MDGSTAAGDDSVAASEKSSDVGGERPDETAVQVPLRKTLSCSAKGILGSKLIESASGPVLPPGSPLSPGSPQCHQYPPMATSASQMLPRESTGPLLWRRTAFPAPVATPQQCPRGGLVVPVVRRSRESSPPCQVMAAPPSWPSSQRPVHVAAAWSQQHSVVRLVHPAQHQVPHAAPELRTRPSVLVQYAIQPQAGRIGMVAVAVAEDLRTSFGTGGCRCCSFSFCPKHSHALTIWSVEGSRICSASEELQAMLAKSCQSQWCRFLLLDLSSVPSLRTRRMQ